MTKLSKKGVLLFAAAMAVCAIGMPSVASAASWGPIGLETTLDSPDLGFTSVIFGTTLASQCTRSSLTAEVRSAAVLTITSASFGGPCTTTFNGTIVCTTTAVGTRFPWVATVPTTSNVQFHGVHIDLLAENTPGNASCAAAGLNGLKVTTTGTLGGGSFSNREIRFSNAEGLVQHSPLGNNSPFTVRATFSSTQNLTVTG